MFANHLTLLFELDHILVLDLSAKQKKYKSYFLVKEIKDFKNFKKEPNNIYLCNCTSKFLFSLLQQRLFLWILHFHS